MTGCDKMHNKCDAKHLSLSHFSIVLNEKNYSGNAIRKFDSDLLQIKFDLKKNESSLKFLQIFKITILNVFIVILVE